MKKIHLESKRHKKWQKYLNRILWFDLWLSTMKTEFSWRERYTPELPSHKSKVTQQVSRNQRRISGFLMPALDYLWSAHLASNHTLLLVDYFGFVLLELRYSLHLLISQYFEICYRSSCWIYVTLVCLDHVLSFIPATTQGQQGWNVLSCSWIRTWQQHWELLYYCYKRKCDMKVVICVQAHVLILALDRRRASERYIYLEHY